MKLKNSLLSAFALILFLPINTSAELITTLDFDDSIWTVTTFTTDTTSPAQAGNLHGQSGGTVTVDKDGGTNTIGIQISLNGSISTAGFEDIELHFTFAPSNSNLDWTSSISPTGGTNQDGMAFAGSGVDFRPNDDDGNIGEAALDAGGTFTPSSTGVTGIAPLNLNFASSVDNSSITELDMALSVNANDEVLTISNVQIHGTAIAPIPEPASLGMFAIAMGLISRRRRA